MDEILVRDLMTKLADDSNKSLGRVLQLYATTMATKEERCSESFQAGAINIIRAGMTPFLRELMGTGNPEAVVTAVALQVIIISRVLSGKRDLLGAMATKNASNDLMAALAKLMKQEIER